MNTEAMTNVTFDEIEIGARASLSRTVTQTAVEVLALLSGDVDPFVLQGNGREEVRPDANSTEAAGAEALIAAVLGTQLPGPGMHIVRQELTFQGTVHTGDQLTATVEAQEKRAETREVVFDCRCLNHEGQTLIAGKVTVVAPTKRVTYSEVAPPELVLRRGDGLLQLLHACQALPAVRCRGGASLRSRFVTGAVRSRPSRSHHSGAHRARSENPRRGGD